MTSLRAVVVALVAVAAACAAPARAQTTMGDATSADTERGNVAGLDESAPCCRICPGLFYSVKPTPWMAEVVKSERDGAETAFIEATGTVAASTFLREARRLSELKTSAGAAARRTHVAPPRATASSFMQEVMRVNAHKQIEKLCCNVCREEYVRDMRYPDMLDYEGGPEGPAAEDSAADAARRPRFREEGYFDDLKSQVKSAAGDLVNQAKSAAGGVLKDAGIDLSSIGVSGTKYDPTASANARRLKNAAHNLKMAATNRAMLDNAPQMLLNKKLAPCCNMCPAGCPPVYVDDAARAQLTDASDIKPQDAPPGSYLPSENEKKRREREKGVEAGTADARECCARTEEVPAYVVVPGDSLPSIGEQYCVTFADLQGANPDVVVDPNHVAAGTRIRIPKPNCSPPPKPSAAQAADAEATAEAVATGKPKKKNKNKNKNKKKGGGGGGSFVELGADMDLDASRGRVGFLGKVMSAVKSGVSHVKRHVSTAVSHVKRHVGNVVSHVKRHVGNVVSHVKRHVGNVVSHVKRHVGNAIKHVGNHVKTFVGHIKRHATNAWNAVKTVAKKVWTHVAAPFTASAAANDPNRFNLGALGDLVRKGIAALHEKVTKHVGNFFKLAPVIPIKVAPPGERYFADKSAQTTEFDPPGVNSRPDQCNAKVLQNCCHVCYTHWPEQHPRAEAKRRREAWRRAQAIKAFRAEQDANNGGAASARSLEEKNQLPYLQNPYLLQGGKQEGQIAEEAQKRAAADAARDETAAADLG